MLNAGIERSPRVPSKSPMADFRAEARGVFPRIEASPNSELKNGWIWEKDERAVQCPLSSFPIRKCGKPALRRVIFSGSSQSSEQSEQSRTRIQGDISKLFI